MNERDLARYAAWDGLQLHNASGRKVEIRACAKVEGPAGLSVASSVLIHTSFPILTCRFEGVDSLAVGRWSYLPGIRLGGTWYFETLFHH